MYNHKHSFDEEHERCLRFMYNHKHSSDEELSQKEGSISIHHKNIQDVIERSKTP